MLYNHGVSTGQFSFPATEPERMARQEGSSADSFCTSLPQLDRQLPKIFSLAAP